MILGDLHILKQRINPSLIFRQGIKHEEYLRYLDDRFMDFCPLGPTIQVHTPDKRTGKVYSAPPFNFPQQSLDLETVEARKNSVSTPYEVGLTLFSSNFLSP